MILPKKQVELLFHMCTWIGKDQIYRTGLTQDHNLSFMNSTKTSNFRASLSHMNIEGVIKGSSKTRNIARLNYSQKAFDDIVTINTRLAGTIEKNEYINYWRWILSY